MVAPPSKDGRPDQVAQRPAPTMPASDRAEQTTMVAAFSLSDPADDATELMDADEGLVDPKGASDVYSDDPDESPVEATYDDNPFGDEEEPDNPFGGGFDEQLAEDSEDASFLDGEDPFGTGSAPDDAAEDLLSPELATTQQGGVGTVSGNVAPTLMPLDDDDELDDASAVYLKQDGKVYMVQDWATLGSWVIEGRVGREDLVSEGGVRWSPIGAHPSAADAFSELERRHAPPSELKSDFDDEMPVEDTSEMSLGPTPFFGDDDEHSSTGSFEYDDGASSRGGRAFPSDRDTDGVSLGLPSLPSFGVALVQGSLSETTDDPMDGDQQQGLDDDDVPEHVPAPEIPDAPDLPDLPDPPDAPLAEDEVDDSQEAVVDDESYAEAVFEGESGHGPEMSAPTTMPEVEEPPSNAPPAMLEDEDPPSNAPPAILEDEEPPSNAPPALMDDEHEELNDGDYSPPMTLTPPPAALRSMDPDLDPASSQGPPISPTPAHEFSAVDAPDPVSEDLLGGTATPLMPDPRDEEGVPPDDETSGFGSFFDSEPEVAPVQEVPSLMSRALLPLAALATAALLAGVYVMLPGADEQPDTVAIEEDIGSLLLNRDSDPPAPPEVPPEATDTDKPETDTNEPQGDYPVEGVDDDPVEEIPSEPDLPVEPVKVEAPPAKKVAPPVKKAPKNANVAALADKCWDNADTNAAKAIDYASQALAANGDHQSANLCMGYTYMVAKQNNAKATSYLCKAKLGGGTDGREAAGMLDGKELVCR